MPASSVDRQRLIAAIENGSSLREAAAVLQLPVSTAYRIARQHRLEGRTEALPRGGQRLLKVDDEMRQFLNQKLQENPFLTLKEMANCMAAQFPEKPQVGYKTVDRMLQGMLYTLKLGTKGSDTRASCNLPENIEARREYANFMLHLDASVHIVYLDETGFNLWLRRSQGRAIRGRPVKRTVTTQRGPNVTVCMAICAEFGLVHSTVQRGGQTLVRFQEFINFLAERCNELDADGSWLVVMDGPHFHRGARVPEQLQEKISIRILPPYSPFLNPSELANSALKARIKSRLADAGLVNEEAVAPDGVNQEEWRFMLLEREAREAIDDTVTAGKAAAWDLHCRRLFGQCIEGRLF